MENSDEGAAVEPTVSIKSVARLPRLVSRVSEGVSEMAVGAFAGKVALQ